MPLLNPVQPQHTVKQFAEGARMPRQDAELRGNVTLPVDQPF